MKPSFLNYFSSALPERRIFIFVLLIVLVLSATIFRQIILNSFQLVKENETKRKRLEVMTGKANYLESLDKNQLEKRVRELEQVFPSKKPALEIINSLNSLAVQEGVSLSTFSLKPGRFEKEGEDSAGSAGRSIKVKTTVQDFLLEFSISGQMEKVTGFIKDLQKTAPLTQIEDLNISIKNGEETRFLTVGLAVRVYYQPLPKTIPAVETPLAYLTTDEEMVLEELAFFKYFPLEIKPTINLGKEDLFK